MHADDPDRAIADQQFGEDRAARLERRQLDRLDIEHPDMGLHQQGIAVPADVARIQFHQPLGMEPAGNFFEQAVVAHAESHRLVHAVAVDQFMRHRRTAPAHALVRLLQGDDIGVDLLEHRQHSIRIAPAVGADGFAHIVGCDGEGGEVGHSRVQSSPFGIVSEFSEMRFPDTALTLTRSASFASREFSHE